MTRVCFISMRITARLMRPGWRAVGMSETFRDAVIA